MFKANYPLHSIITGKYTQGKEYKVWDDVIDYIGLYHILPNGQIWTGDIPQTDSKRLVEYKQDQSQSVMTYNKIKKQIQIDREIPVSYYPSPSTQDYILGYIFRCFVQKRNNPLETIIEITPDQYNSISINNTSGVNPVIWNSVEIKWSLTKTLAVDLNRRNIIEAEKKFKGIGKYLNNPLEFCR